LINEYSIVGLHIVEITKLLCRIELSLNPIRIDYSQLWLALATEKG